MADAVISGPLAQDLFGIGGNWIPQSDDNDDTSERAACLGANGDEIASKQYDGKNQVSVKYKCKEIEGNLVLPNAGSVHNGYMIDSIELTPSPNDWPELTVTGHNHDAHAHEDDRVEFAPSLTFAAGFGIPQIFSQSNAACARLSLSYKLSCAHNDIGDGAGNHLVGDNSNGKEELSAEFAGTPSFTVTAGWDQLSKKDSHSNTEKDKTSYSWVHPVARVA